jgi:ubiquinone/menaquinone biosynthesis C-methylase UbiE
MASTDTQKQLAIDQHSVQAGEFADRYGELATDRYATCFAYSRARLDVLLARYLPRDGTGIRLLDLGCGTGHHMARLGRQGFDVAGVDGSEEMLSHARTANPGADLRQSDVEAIPFPDASFDVVLCIEVLRYLPDSSRCVREMARVLKPGGVCLTTATPILNLNGYWLINRVANLVRLGDLVRLKQFFTTSGGLRRRFNDAGFRTIGVHGVYLGPVNWVERLTPGVLHRALRVWEPLDASITDLPGLRELSNMFLVRAVRNECLKK